MNRYLPFAILCLVAALSATACGGGGGGGGGGGEGRTRETAVRIIHAALDAAPVTLIIGEVTLQTARYAQLTSYAPVEEGEVILNLQRANSPGVTVTTLPATLEGETEYSLLLFDRVSSGGLKFALIEDIVSQSDEGFGLFQLVNGYDADGTISATIGGVAVGPIAQGVGSGFSEIVSGPQTITITRSGGGTLGTLTVDIPDRGELTLVVTGAEDLGVAFFPAYTDLD